MHTYTHKDKQTAFQKNSFFYSGMIKVANPLKSGDRVLRKHYYPILRM
jgi:hypothetical protein